MPDKHAFLSPSSSERWFNCTPSSWLCEQFPDQGSVFAAEGTEAHRLCEYLLNQETGVPDTDPRPDMQYYTREMEEAAQGYVRYIRERTEAWKARGVTPRIFAEQRVDLRSFIPESMGTSDCVLVAEDEIEIVDFKYGMYRVPASSLQLRMESLGKKEVQALLKDASPEIREVLLLRQQLAKSSVRKYQAMEETVCRDGRIRGMFQFYGASRSGRWAGRGVQLQNLPQNHLPDLDAARKLVLSGEYDALKLLYDTVPDVLSELIRTAFVPAKGKKFVVADFSAVEARVIAWFAGEQWRMEVFASGGDIYCASASRMFHVPVEKHGVNGHLRQKGKIAELALGYGGGACALRSMGTLEMGVPEEELKPLVEAWRTANPQICRLWREVDRAVKTAVREKRAVKCGSLEMEKNSGVLFIRLPSGRKLCYVKPRLGVNSFGSESVLYYGLNAAKKWALIESYGPKFVENIVQGASRDLLCAAMRRLEERGYRIVAHVHDEVIAECDEEADPEEVCRIMGEGVPWSEGLLLRAEGYECMYYKKS